MGDIVFALIGIALLGGAIALTIMLLDNSLDRATFEGVGPDQVRVTFKGVATVYTTDNYNWYSPSGDEVAYTAFELRLGQARRTWKYKATRGLL